MPGETRAEVSGWTVDTLRAWILNILDERSKRFDQRFGELKESLRTELMERDKAVEVLATSLARSIEEGDDNLRDHIKQQVEQIRAALASSEKLEISHLERIQSQLESLKREISLSVESSREAVDKVAVANEKRFESVNEFRGQMADQVNTFIPRREVETMMGAAVEKIGALTDRFNRNEGRGSGLNAGWLYLIGGISLIGALIAILNYFSTH